MSSSIIAGGGKDALNLVVLISGSGTNLQALIDNIRTLSPFPDRLARISLVLSNRKAALGLSRAQSACPAIPTQVFSLAAYRAAHPGSDRESYDLALADEVKKAKPDLVVLAGFMHVLSSGFLQRLRKDWRSDYVQGDRIRIINLHPALPGQFDGANAIQRAWMAGPAGRKEITKTGVMIHEVVPEVDRGRPLVVREVSLKEDETLEELEARMHEVEHDLIVEGTREALKCL